MFRNKKVYIFIGVLISFLVFFFCLVGLEILLRTWPTMLLGNNFTNEIRSKYHGGDDGIYWYDSALRIKRMKPHYETTMYFNEYEWHHTTNADGFRIADDRTDADIVLLGDSLIYGHGLDDDESIGYLLDAQSQLTSANLALQGNGSFDNFVIFNAFTFNYHPKYIFYFFFGNDLTDFRGHQDVDVTLRELNDFVATPLDEFDFSNLQPSPYVEHTDESRPLAIEVAVRFFVHRALEFLGVEAPLDGYTDFEDELLWEYTEKVLQYMKYKADAIDAEFVLVPATTFYQYTNVNDEQYERLHTIADDYDISFIDSRSIGRDSKNFLHQHYDGHYSEDGAQVIVDLLLQFIADHPDGV